LNQVFFGGIEKMKSYFRGAVGAALLAGLAIACGDTPNSPTAPAGALANTALGPDNSNLKVTAPTPTSPVNDFQTEGNPTLVASPAAGKYTDVALQYNFELYNAANQRVQSATVNTPSYPVTGNLDYDSRYTWRVRATIAAQNAVGPWSTTASFKSPVGGYIKDKEIFDPLTNGKTVARFTRGITWMGAQGVRLDGQESVVEYRVPTTLTSGEFSVILTNIGNGSEEWKTKVMSMLEDDGVNITDNVFRVTVDKRSTAFNQDSPARFTFCVRTQNECHEPTAGGQSWSRQKTYFWKFTWGGGEARLQIFDGGTPAQGGARFVNVATGYGGTWNPSKMLVRLGSVGGRAGSDTNPNTIARNLWVSQAPRPNFKDDK
jgi:hypothetical protein